jgi:hypothetical protein
MAPRKSRVSRKSAAMKRTGRSLANKAARGKSRKGNRSKGMKGSRS